MNKSFRFLLFFLLFSAIYHLSSPISYAATYSLNPSSTIFHQGCSSSVDIVLDTQGGTTNAADIIIDYDTAKIEIIDSDPSQTGVQIKPGNVFQNYFGNIVDVGGGVIRLTGASFTNFFTASGVFATIQFKPKTGFNSGTLNIRFTGAGPYITHDSNIADASTSNDLLTSVQNGNYIFNDGTCTADTTPPIITFISPINNQTGVPATAQIQLSIADSPAGVNLNTVQIVINGTTYLANNPAVTVSGTTAIYTFTISPLDPLFTNQANTILVKASDLAGNSTQKSITFNSPPSPTVSPLPTIGPLPTCPIAPGCPICSSITPTPSPTGQLPDTNSPTIEFVRPQNKEVVAPDSLIQFRLSDPDSGINPDTIKITFNGSTINFANPSLSSTGSNYSLLITFKPHPTPSPGSTNTLTVFVADQNGNGLTQSISFSIRPDSAPVSFITNIIKSITTPTTSTSSIVLALALAIPVLALAYLLLRLLQSFLTHRHHHRPYGCIYHAVNQQPLENATIAILDHANHQINFLSTDKYGLFYTDLASGQYKFIVSHPGFQSATEIITVDSPFHPFLSIPLTPSKS